MELKSVPHAEYAERAVLGAMLINSLYIDQIQALRVSSDYFYRDSHKIIFDAIIGMHLKQGEVDLVQTVERIKEDGKLKFIGGFEYIASLLDGMPDKIDISRYVDTLKENYTLRRIILSAASRIDEATSPGPKDTEGILSGALQDLRQIQEQMVPRGFVSASEIVENAAKFIEKIQTGDIPTGIATGLHNLDDLLAGGGFQKGDLIIIAARPSMGKTALALSIAMNISKNYTVGFFSLEMTKRQIGMRLKSATSLISLSSLMKGNVDEKGWGKIEAALNRISKMKLYIDDSADITVEGIRAQSRMLYREKGLDVIFVDYLQLIKSTSNKAETRADVVAKISSDLKSLAKELDIPVVALAQLNRQPEQRLSTAKGKNKGGSRYRYHLSDLKESGAIEQDADVIMFLHRDTMDPDRLDSMDIQLEKQRQGERGVIDIAFYPYFVLACNEQDSLFD